MPLALTEKVAVCPAATEASSGWAVIVGVVAVSFPPLDDDDPPEDDDPPDDDPPDDDDPPEPPHPASPNASNSVTNRDIPYARSEMRREELCFACGRNGMLFSPCFAPLFPGKDRNVNVIASGIFGRGGTALCIASGATFMS